MNTLRIWAWMLTLTTMALSGCESSNGGSDTPTVQDPASEMEGQTTPVSGDPSEPTAEIESTFQAIQVRIFEAHGCTEAACHGMAEAGGLNLLADVSYDQLVDVPSESSELKRIEPGERTRSYLYQKLLAATDDQFTPIAGAPMPIGFPPVPHELLEVLRLWIYQGAPEDGTVPGTAELLGIELHPVVPTTIRPLPAPAPEEGFQLEMPPYLLEPFSEHEYCFASYFDIRDQVPDEVKDESGDWAAIRVEQLRQDPQSHHLILNLSRSGVEDIDDPSFGEWRCRGGEMEGATCDPVTPGVCGVGHCATDPVDGFACIGYGPNAGGLFTGSRPIGGAQKAQEYDALPDGVYQWTPLHGILYWNSHAFNLTDVPHVMNGRLNFLYAYDRQYETRDMFRTNVPNIFAPDTPPFQRSEICASRALPQGAHLYMLSSHTHQRGERFRIFHPDGTMLYENLLFNDPHEARFEPPLVFDSSDVADRTLTFCAVYNNGVGPDGEPDPETVTRYSRLPETVFLPGVPGLCRPIACAAGRIGERCNGETDHAACDSEPGAGDGLCDACAITGGESTENEMFMMLGKYYLPQD